MNKLIFAITRLMTKVLGNLASRTIGMSKKTGSEEVTDNPLLKKLEATYETYDEVIIKPLSSGLGKAVVQADQARDNIYMGIKSMVNGMARLTGAKAEAARAIQKLFDEAGGSITGMDYASESEVIKKLLKSLATDEAKAHISTLGITDEVALLAPAQDAFREVFMKQAKQNAALNQMGSASALRRELENALRSYYAFVWAMKDVVPWKSLYVELVELVKAAKNTIGKPETDINIELQPGETETPTENTEN